MVSNKSFREISCMSPIHGCVTCNHALVYHCPSNSVDILNHSATSGIWRPLIVSDKKEEWGVPGYVRLCHAFCGY